MRDGRRAAARRPDGRGLTRAARDDLVEARLASPRSSRATGSLPIDAARRRSAGIRAHRRRRSRGARARRGLGRRRSPPTAGARSTRVDARPGDPRPRRDLHGRAQLPAPASRPDAAPERPLVYGKAAASVAADGATLAWDRSLTDERRRRVRARRRHRRDGVDVAPTMRWPRLRLHVHRRRLVARRVARRRPVAARQVDARVLPGRAVDRHRRRARPGRPRASAARSTASRSRTAARRDALRRSPRSSRTSAATSRSGRATSSRPGRRPASPAPPGPDRHLRPGDVVTCWIEGIGELTTTIA